MSILPQTQHSFPLPKKLIFWGGSGQAKVIYPIIQYYGSEVVAVIDSTVGLKSPFPGIPIIHDSEFDSWIQKTSHLGVGFCITIGNPHGQVRINLHNKLISLGLIPATVIHPTAWITSSAHIGLGSQIQTFAVVETESVLGIQCIVNTKASVDHECVLGDGTEMAPGATLCGCITTEKNAWICAGATVLPRIHIGENSIIGAGSVVIEDVPDNTTVIGVPAKPLIRNKNKT